MFTLLDSPDDVIAIHVAGHIAGADIDKVMDRLEAMMARHDEVHVFVETHAIDGVEIAGLPAYFKRALPLYGKLSHFGRVAVVADQSWVRIATRVESALLPHISYRTFEPEQRDAAFAWVAGNAV
jgi:hypothetical protein